MTLVAVGSPHGAPGVTTVAVGLARAWWAAGRPALLLEADPDGGVLAARLGVSPRPGLTELAGRARADLDPDAFDDLAQPLPGGLPALLAHPSAEQTAAALRVGAARVAGALAADGCLAVVDVGRVRPATPARPLVEAAAVVVVVTRPDAGSLAVLAHARRLLPPAERLAVVLVGDRPYPPGEVAAALELEVAAVLPVDPRDAAALAAGRLAARRPLARSIVALAGGLLDRLADRVADPVPGR